MIDIGTFSVHAPIYNPNVREISINCGHYWRTTPVTMDLVNDSRARKMVLRFMFDDSKEEHTCNSLETLRKILGVDDG